MKSATIIIGPDGAEQVQLCVDCAHCIKDNRFSEFYKCKCYSKRTIDLVSGETINNVCYCSSLRKTGGMLCRNFTPKPEPPNLWQKIKRWLDS